MRKRERESGKASLSPQKGEALQKEGGETVPI